MTTDTVRLSNTPEKYTRTEWMALAAFTLIALASRLYGTWHWSISGDEYYTVAYAAERSRNLLQPAYYALVVWATDLLGSSNWSVRLPSVLVGTVSVPVCYWAFRDMLGRRAATIGTLLVLFHGWHLYHSQLSRFYSGVFLFGILSYILYYKALRNDNYWFLGGALLANLVGILFHATAVLVPAACGVFSLYVWIRGASEVSGYSRRIARAHVLVFGVLGLAAVPALWRIATMWAPKGGTNLSLSEPIGVTMQLVLNVEPIVLVSALFGLLYVIRQDLTKGLFFLVGIGIPFLGLLVAAVLLPPVRAKYIISTLPLFIGLSGFFCAVMLDAASRVTSGVFKHAVTALILLSLLPGFFSQYTGQDSLDIRDVLNALDEEYRPGDRIVAFSHSSGYHLGMRYPEEALDVVGGMGAWRNVLNVDGHSEQRTWVLVNIYRNQRLDTGLQAWLLNHAVLVWRKYNTRYDYSMTGFELFLVDGTAGAGSTPPEDVAPSVLPEEEGAPDNGE